MAFLALIAFFLSVGVLLSLGVMLFWQSTHRLMFAIGAIALASAYSTAIVANLGIASLWASLVGVACGCLLGAGIALVAHRLAEEQFLLLALAFSELVRRVALEARPLTGGAYGLRVDFGTALPGAIPVLSAAVLMVGALFITQWWLRTTTGLGWRMVGEARYAAVLAGLDPRRVEGWSGMATGLAAALAGALHIAVLRYVHPDDFGISLSLGAVAVGVAANPRYLVRDVLALSILLFALRELLRLSGGTGAWRFAVHDVVAGVVVVGVAMRLRRAESEL